MDISFKLFKYLSNLMIKKLSFFIPQVFKFAKFYIIIYDTLSRQIYFKANITIQDFSKKHTSLSSNVMEKSFNHKTSTFRVSTVKIYFYLVSKKVRNILTNFKLI
jgi:hypothetical protein